MPAALASAVNSIAASLADAATDLILPALVFIALAFIAHGAASVQRARAAGGEITTNMALLVFDIIVVTPLLALALGATGGWMQRYGVALLHTDFWSAMPAWLVGFLAIFFGDFIGYWRHRLEHTAPLWPAHAVHHSDTRMTWTTIYRFHPINRLSTALIDTGVLALLGLPPWALALNNLVRHYYGMLDHVDVPWTFGLLGRLLVSPVMHRWHHIRDADGAGVNFATVFSVFDQGFGTYSVPGQCTVPLGVREAIGAGAASQLAYPFKVAGRYLLGRSGPTARDGEARGSKGAAFEPALRVQPPAAPE